MSQFHKNFIIRVIDLYGLELDGDRVDTPIDTWLQTYDPTWIVKAIVESLYRGRYKIKSIDNILKDWQRLGKPRYNFTPEYERGILRNLPEQTDLLATSTPLTSSLPVIDVASIPVARLDTKSSVTPPLSGKNLNPEESAPFQRHDRSLPIAQLDNTQFEVPIFASQNLEIADLAHNSPEDTDRQLGFLSGSAGGNVKDPEERGEISSGSGEMADDFVVNSTVEYPEGGIAAQLPTSAHHTSHQQFPLPSSLEILPGRGFTHRDLHNDGVGQKVSQPVKHHLFNILKAIVDPNNQQSAEAEVPPSVCLPLYIVNTNSSSNKQLVFPLENTSEEQCF